MLKRICLLNVYLLICFYLSSSAVAADCQDFSNLEYILQMESSAIENNSIDNPSALAEAYLSRAETYLLTNRVEEAFSDFSNVLNLSMQIPDEANEANIRFRAYFGMTIVESVLGNEESALNYVSLLEELIKSFYCFECKYSNSLTIRFPEQKHYWGVEILGPDEEPRKGWCEEIVHSTAAMMEVLALKAKLGVRTALIGIIKGLEIRAVKCCQSGEFWKACVEPIVAKWKQWNDKWDVLRIPPDPLWDDPLPKWEQE